MTRWRNPPGGRRRPFHSGPGAGQNEDGGPHGPDELVSGFIRSDVPYLDGEGIALDVILGPQLFHEGEDGEDVLDKGDVRQVELLVGEQAGGDRRQDGVLRSADPDFSLEAQVLGPPDPNSFHRDNSKGSARKRQDARLAFRFV